MFMGEFVKKNHTTKDRIRYYIELGLLTPIKKNQWYCFEDKDQQVYESIIELKELGFSIKGIQKIYRSHLEKCGTIEQWQENLAIVKQEIVNLEEEIKGLASRKVKLMDVKNDLVAVIEANEKGKESSK